MSFRPQFISTVPRAKKDIAVVLPAAADVKVADPPAAVDTTATAPATPADVTVDVSTPAAADADVAVVTSSPFDSVNVDSTDTSVDLPQTIDFYQQVYADFSSRNALLAASLQEANVSVAIRAVVAIYNKFSVHVVVPFTLSIAKYVRKIPSVRQAKDEDVFQSVVTELVKSLLAVAYTTASASIPAPVLTVVTYVLPQLFTAIGADMMNKKQTIENYQTQERKKTVRRANKAVQAKAFADKAAKKSASAGKSCLPF